MPGAQIKIRIIRGKLQEFVRRMKEGAKFRQWHYPRKQNEIKEVVKCARLRYKSISPLKDAGDFDDGEFYGFCGDFELNKQRWGEEMETEIEGRQEIIDT